MYLLCQNLQNLTVSEVKGLLGSNLEDLKTFENDSVVQAWVAEQLQLDLDTLNLGLKGGKAGPGVVPSLNPTNMTTSNITTSAPTNLTVVTTNTTQGKEWTTPTNTHLHLTEIMVTLHLKPGCMLH